MDNILPADETPLSTDSQRNQLEPGRHRRLQSFIKRLVSGRRTYSASSMVAAIALVVSSVSTNLSTSRTLADGLDSYVTPDPKVKATLMASVDEFTPLINEANDADAVVTAEVLPKDFAIQKTSSSQVVSRADQAAAVAAANPAPRPKTYTVKVGDTFSTIAANFDLKQGTLRVANLKVVADADDLKPGDVLTIPASNYSESYVNQQIAKAEASAAAAAKKNEATKLASASSKRSVVVRDQSEAAGGVSFARPAGALGQNGYHAWAIDIPPSGGLGIYASESGTVREVGTGWNGGYGNMIIISHGGGWETLYAHLSSISVSPGQTVSQGQSIGVMGATGRTIPKGAVHLHFEIRKNGQKLNPIQYIR